MVVVTIVAQAGPIRYESFVHPTSGTSYLWNNIFVAEFKSEMFVFHSMQPCLLLLWQQMHWVLSPSPRHGHVCLSAVGPCNADACNDTIPLGINTLPLLALPPLKRRVEGK